MIKTNLVPGLTLIHEHTTIDLSSQKNNQDCNLNSYQETLQEYRELYELGVRNIVDLTAEGMGRDVSYVRDIAEKSGINILHATGYYKEPFLPKKVYTLTVQNLADEMIKEINIGIEGSSIKASVIGEIGTSLNKMTDLEKKVFDAAIIASKNTGTVISTHTTLGTFGIEQVKYLMKNGVSPNKIIIGHQDLSNNLDQIIEILSYGVYVAFDTIGKNDYLNDSNRIYMLYELQKIGKLDQLVLSLDITRKSQLSSNGGIGYTYMFKKFIPMMIEYGITLESIDKMLNKNPIKIFGGGEI